MSYVIQNFSNYPKLIVVTPRFRFTIILTLMPHLCVLFNFNFYCSRTTSNWKIELNHLSFFYKFLHISQPGSLVRSLNLKYVGNYSNNYLKSVVFHSLSRLENHFCAPTEPLFKEASHQKLFLYNSRFLARKTANYKINKEFYLSSFFWLLAINTRIWSPRTRVTFFYFNFILINLNDQIFHFYNGRFFKIYNF